MVTVNVGISGSSNASGKNIPLNISVYSGSLAAVPTVFASPNVSFPTSSGSNYLIVAPNRFVDANNVVWKFVSFTTGSPFAAGVVLTGNQMSGSGASAGGININYAVVTGQWAGGGTLNDDRFATTDNDSPDSEMVFAQGARDGAMIVRLSVGNPPQ
jgi:hypothetical protein